VTCSHRVGLSAGVNPRFVYFLLWDEHVLRVHLPHCAERVTVNDTMRETMLRVGCVICGASVSTESFD